jgi:hypothetical protein
VITRSDVAIVAFDLLGPGCAPLATRLIPASLAGGAAKTQSARMRACFTMSLKRAVSALNRLWRVGKQKCADMTGIYALLTMGNGLPGKRSATYMLVTQRGNSDGPIQQ